MTNETPEHTHDTDGAQTTAPPPPLISPEAEPLLPPEAPSRPAGATVVGILCLVFAVWSLISLASGFMSLATMDATVAQMAAQGITMPEIDPTPNLILAALGLAGFAITGIGLLAKAAWSRRAAIGVLLADWVLCTAATFIGLAQMTDFYDALHARTMSPMNGQTVLLFTGGTSIISLGVVLILVYVLTRPVVVEAYR